MTAYTFPTATPESLGIPSQAVIDLLEAVRREDLVFNSIQILRHGKRCVEAYYDPYGPDDAHVCFSFTKSVVSTAIGMLVAEGKITLDDKVLSFFPEDAPENPSENLKEMNIRHLLTMTCGHEREPFVREENWVRGFLAHPVPRKPGTFFVYNSRGSYMLAAIIKKVTGQNFTEYLKPRLFDKMGIEGYSCSTCPRGIENGGGGLSMRPRDMAKLAQLWLNRGVWEGETLVDPAYIDDATSIHIIQAEGWSPVKYAGMENAFAGYGYQVWRNTVPGTYRFDGMFGQLALILPKFDMAVVITAATLRIYKILNTVWRMLIPALEPEALPEDPEAKARLDAYLASLSVPWTETMPRQKAAEAVLSGRRILFPNNDLAILPGFFAKGGLTDLTVTFGEETATLAYTQNGVKEETVLGLDGTRLRGQIAGAAVAGTLNWLDETRCVIDLNHVNHVYHETITLTLKGGRDVDMTLYLTPNDCDIPSGSKYRPAQTIPGTLE